MAVLLMIVSAAHAQQLHIPRIDLMPDFPQPYLMRDWESVARGYDSLVFNKDLIGEHLPLVFFRSTTVNYPEHSGFGLHTAVGTNNPSAGEGINVMPAVVGASLLGIDKADQYGQNWVLMCEEYFNKRPEENIYLNHPVSRSGIDWWYETMPNIFFLQLNSLYPHMGDFDYQIVSLANQWLKATSFMGGSTSPWKVPNLNYRAWEMASMTPLETGLKEPEAAGALAWILYSAYMATGEQKYLVGAEWNLEFLDAYTGNPSYELQLPYGVYTAARLNAEIGTKYDIEKMVNWCFDQGELRGWGAIVGKWGDYDCSGLIGEANDGGNDYAFAMNGYEQAGALLPMLRYDERFATSIAKWVLNLANASRLFYPNYLPDEMQDNAEWAHLYDPDSFIGYESMKENKNNKSPYATGDAMDGGWASTNLMLYSSSHVGILGAIINTSNVEGILRLDLLKTDYYGGDAYPTFLYYNPYETEQSPGVILPSGTFDLYDAISNSSIESGVTGSTTLSIPSKEAMMVVIYPSDSGITMEGSRTYAGDVIIDYNNGIIITDKPPRIKALGTEELPVLTDETIQLYCTASDPEEEVLHYEWTIDGVTTSGLAVQAYNAPDTPGIYQVGCKISDPTNQWDTLSMYIQVVKKIMNPPEILDIKADPLKVHLGGTIDLSCLAQDENKDTLFYEWTSVSGTLVGEGHLASYTAPDSEGNYFIVCKVTDTDGLYDSDSISVMVRDLSLLPEGNIIAYYPLNGNALDESGKNNHGIYEGVNWINDRDGSPGQAAFFDGVNDFVHIPNNDVLNFQEAMSIACWINIDQYLAHEQHPISHGSWQDRYKISLGDQYLRFTLNTTATIKDLDSETSPEAGKWYHLAITYNGSEMELWLDGKLDAFIPQSGQINKTTYDLAFGQNLPGDNNYNFKGALDAVSIFDFGLFPSQIKDLMENGIGLGLPGKASNTGKRFLVFPNPLSGQELNIRILPGQAETITLALYDLSGRQLGEKREFKYSESETILSFPVAYLVNGAYLISIVGEDWIGYELINIVR